MQWETGQVTPVNFGKAKPQIADVEWKTRDLPLQYAWLISQFEAEEYHSWYNYGHEAIRRQGYVRRMLDALANELESIEVCGGNFRSKVLTPVLQRQLQGLPDAYAPSIHSALADNQGVVTIAKATRFYLGEDPLHPGNISMLRRNIIYSREARRHLSLVYCHPISGTEAYNLSIRNQDHLMNNPKDLRGGDGDGKIPAFSYVEMLIVVSEGLEDFFRVELKDQVRIHRCVLLFVVNAFCRARCLMN
jgi:hypothetical protein